MMAYMESNFSSSTSPVPSVNPVSPCKDLPLPPASLKQMTILFPYSKMPNGGCAQALRREQQTAPEGCRSKNLNVPAQKNFTACNKNEAGFSRPSAPRAQAANLHYEKVTVTYMYIKLRRQNQPSGIPASRDSFWQVELL